MRGMHRKIASAKTTETMSCSLSKPISLHIYLYLHIAETVSRYILVTALKHFESSFKTIKLNSHSHLTKSLLSTLDTESRQIIAVGFSFHFTGESDLKPEPQDPSSTTSTTTTAGTVTTGTNSATSHLVYLHQLQSKQIALAEGLLNLLHDFGGHGDLSTVHEIILG